MLNSWGVFVYKEVMVSEEQSVMQTINDALLHHDPQKLTQLSEYFSTWDNLLKLREIIGTLNINPNYYGVSHYGRDDPETDRLLHALEKMYAKLYPDRIPPGFRQ